MIINGACVAVEERPIEVGHEQSRFRTHAITGARLPSADVDAPVHEVDECVL